jgi:hypothetical protein
MFSKSQMLNTFVLDASTCARGKNFCIARPGGVKIALVAGLALASIGLTAGEAHAVVVNVGGHDWDVTTFTGSFLDNISKFQTPANGGVMPWWTTGPEGTSAIAVQFAAAVGTALGTPNGSPDPDQGPFFGFNQFIYTPDPQTALNAVYWNPPSSSVYGYNYGWGDSWVYAQATLVASPTPVPAPLPLFGVAAAFGASRQIRKRIKASKGVSSLPTPV